MNTKPRKGTLRTNGRKWMIDLSHNGARYRLTTTLESTKANKAKAELILSSLRTDLSRNTVYISNYRNKIVNLELVAQLAVNQPSNINIDMKSLIDEQINIYRNRKDINRTLAESTFNCYMYAINNHVYPYFEKFFIHEVDSNLLEAFIETKLIFSRSRIRLVLRPLQAIFRRAFRKHLIEKNPFDGLDPEVISNTQIDTKQKIDPFEHEEINKILDACKYPVIKNIFQFAFWTGCRPGEIFQLCWKDIDIDKGFIYVNKASTPAGKEKETKIYSGERQIEMIPAAKEALLNQLQITGNDNDGIVFKTPCHSVKWKRPSQLGVFWKAAVMQAKVRYRNLYKTRHTFISQMLLMGKPYASISNGWT